MKSLRLIALATSMLVPIAAQAQPVPSSAPPPFRAPTYSASGVLTVPQTAAMDIICINGIAPSTNHPAGLVRVKRMEISGTDATAQSATLQAVMRSAADTGGTSTTATNVPQDSGNAAGSAVVKAYTVAPTPGASIGPVRSAVLPLPDGATLLGVAPLVWAFDPQPLQQEIVLRGVAQGVCFNLPNALSTASASIRWGLTWTEQ